MSKCIICGSNIGNVITSKPEHYCETCWYHENAPILVLTRVWNHGPLFSPKLDKYVYPANHQMENCGFRLFNRKVFFNKVANQRYREVLIYKYNGRVKCLALKGYKAWPIKMPECCKIGCTLR